MYLFRILVYRDSACEELPTESTRISSTLTLLQLTLHSPSKITHLLVYLQTDSTWSHFCRHSNLLAINLISTSNLTSFRFQPRLSLISLPDGKTVKLVSSCNLLMKARFEPFKLAWQSSTNLIQMNSAGRLLLAKLFLEGCLLGFKLVLQFTSHLSPNA